MSDAILILNAGSSSIKFSMFTADQTRLICSLGGQIQRLDCGPEFVARDASGALVAHHQWPPQERLGHTGAMAHLTAFLAEHLGQQALIAVGHRVVHGGLEFQEPSLVTAESLDRLRRLIPLAPLHQPHNLSPIATLLDNQPGLPQVACFDTAFHRSQPEIAQAFALPPEFAERGVCRYGFHGLSYEYIASALPRFDAVAAAGRTIVLHLGNGASMCALRAGRSVATSMGFTALDGIPMGTRCGALDPGVVLYLMDELQMDARAIEELLYRRSGLLGVSGLSADMRTLLASQDPRARFAVALFVYRISRELGSLAAALGGVDAIVFTAGIGEHAAPVREQICRGAQWLGVRLDAAANTADEARISTPDSPTSAWIIPTNEEQMIAKHTLRVVRDHGANV